MTWIKKYDAKKVPSLRLDKSLTDRLWEQARAANVSPYEASKILLTEMLNRQNADLHQLIMSRKTTDKARKQTLNKEQSNNEAT
jgi:hypothetical protein